MNVAILGWGSLIKEPRDLPIVGEWLLDGPKLWIEFSRISRKGDRAGCLTLVIDEECESEVTTFHVLNKRNDLAPAVADLQKREGTSPDGIGFCEIATERIAPKAMSRHPKSCERIFEWAKEKNFDAVVWTALPRRFKDAIGITFTPVSALEYLNGLPAPTKQKALEYIHGAPEQTMTPFRRLLPPATAD
jgi:hypothetical protein